ncbi:MAG: 16S rRNA (guanine(966)-N(2))-methyltransferase RsmD [Thalassobaculales bacterium]
MPATGVRPTGQRVRTVLFDTLAGGRFGTVLPGAVVLDAFAGSGALGLEALSRGAASASFIENAPAALAALRRNIDHLGRAADCRVFARSALAPGPAPLAHGLALLDPPYGQGLAEAALPALAGWLAADALVVVEVAAREGFVPPPGLSLLEERVVGAARLIFCAASGSR